MHVLSTFIASVLLSSPALAQPAGVDVPARAHSGGEAALVLPDLSAVSFHGLDGHRLLTLGLVVCVFGLLFGLTITRRLRRMPVHRSMADISELIYETCKTYLITQGKFILILEAFIARHHRVLLRHAAAPSLPSRSPSFCCSASSASAAVTAWRGSGSG